MHFDLYRLKNIKEIDELNVLEGSKNKIQLLNGLKKSQTCLIIELR